MKKLALVVVLAVVGLVTYNYVSTGELTLLPSGPRTAEEQQLVELQDRFEAAQKQFTQASRTAGLSGMDTTADAEAAMRAMSDIDAGLKKLRSKLDPSSSAGQKAERLGAAVSEFRERLR